MSVTQRERKVHTLSPSGADASKKNKKMINSGKIAKSAWFRDLRVSRISRCWLAIGAGDWRRRSYR
jgi:hypothetical protein